MAGTGSPADAALAAADVAAHLMGALMLRAGGSATDLARVERVCVALRRAGTPHWRALCFSLSPSTAATAAAADGVTDWRRVYAQLHFVAFPAPRCRCADFVFFVDTSYNGAPLFSGCAGPFAGGAHAARRGNVHWLRVAPAGGDDTPAPPTLIAGDVYDWPTRFRARVCARRLADGALAEVARDMEVRTPTPASRDIFESYGNDGVRPQMHTAVLHFWRELPARTRRDTKDAEVTLNVQLFLQAADAADAADEDAADAVEPLFFRKQGYNPDGSPPHGNESRRPRPPLHEAGGGFFRLYPNPNLGNLWPLGSRVEPAAIEEAALARRVVLRRRGGATAALSFGGSDFREDGTPWMAPEAEHRGSCADVCAALDRLVFVPPL
jgi:hypothetical protein